MKKITFLLLSFTTLLTGHAQVVSTVFGSTANEATSEWINEGNSFNQYSPQDQPDNGKLTTRAASSNTIGVMSYAGAYTGTVSSSDVIYVEIRDIGLSSTIPPIRKILVSYSENGGSEITQTIDMADNTTTQELTITPNFTDGATLSNLKLSFTDASGGPQYDVLRIYDFFIGSSATLSNKYRKIDGAKVLAKNGEISVFGANLKAVYNILGQRVPNTDLSSGIYIVEITKGLQSQTVKVALL